MKREEYRDHLAEQFIKVLEEKGLSWKAGWSRMGPPRNGVTGRAYNGVNQLLLHWTAQLKGYQDPRWVTFLQIEDRDGAYHKGQHWRLKKGSKAEWVEYVMPRNMETKKVITWEKFRNEIAGTEEEKKYGVAVKYAAVFNAECVEGMPPLEAEKHPEIDTAGVVDEIARGMEVKVFSDGGDQAYYRPSNDTIHLPAAERFMSEYEYNATLLHELSHASGAAHRLGRDLTGSFGSESYAFEELIAEMSSCFMAAELPLPQSEEHIRNHQAYVSSWIRSIREKPERLREAIKEANRAADYLSLKGGLLSEAEYQKSQEKRIEVPEEREERNPRGRQNRGRGQAERKEKIRRERPAR